jgi:signal transduction histidine kinase
MTQDLSAQMAAVSHGDHLCLVHDTPEEQLAATVPYLAEGLASRQRCVYISEGATPGALLAGLAAAGVDVEAEVARGALVLASVRDIFLPGGCFSPDAMIAFLEATAAAALADGWTGVRATGEMSWALGPEEGCNRLIEYEARLNEFFAGSSMSAICQYDRSRFPAELVEGVLRTHPSIVVGSRLRENPYYEPPELVLAPASARRRVEWMLERLTAAAERLPGDAREAQSTFLSTISHELRTPLNAIVGYTELMDSGMAGELTLPQRGHLARIGANTHHLLEIVEQLLTYSRMEAGRETVRLESVELNGLLRAVARRVEPRASARGLRWRISLPESPTLASTDPVKVRQIVSNFLSNAVKFTERGEVELSLTAEGDHFVVRVADTGIGVPPELREEIFAPFRQADDALTRRAEGMGVGLAVTRGLAEALGGAAYVECTSPRGSTFAVRLPRNLPPST